MEIPTVKIGADTFVIPSLMRRLVAHLLDFVAAAAVAAFVLLAFYGHYTQ